MIGQQIRTKRRSLGLSLQELADEMAINGLGVSRAVLSNYELGRTVPSVTVLKEIAKALGTSVDYLKSGNAGTTDIHFFDEPDLIPKKKNELISYIQLNIDNQLVLDDILGRKSACQIPEPVKISKYDPVLIEKAVQTARKLLHFENSVISSVIGTLENNGWYIFDLGSNIHVKTVSGVATGEAIPFLAYRRNSSTAVLRFLLLRELSKAFLSCTDPSLQEAVTETFSMSMLLPKSRMTADFGKKRKHVSYYELDIAKQRYGISRFHISNRLHQLGIIDETERDRLIDMLQRVFLLEKTSALDTVPFYEHPEALRIKYLRAISENLLTDKMKEQFDFIGYDPTLSYF